ncbi:hypothetical protein EON65_18590 [archaeon]|nr:MAG: hypothetical protein EON65_18590 [archaeon]
MSQLALLFVFLLYSCHKEVCDARLSAVMATTWKDMRVFEKSLESALKHIPEVDKFYIITPNHKELKEKYSGLMYSRVEVVNEEIFPFHKGNVSDVMIEAVKQKGVYPISGGSQFEKTVWHRSGWFMQQLFKLYAGNVLGLEDYLLLDSDLIWFRNITFINATQDGVVTYNYVSSSQYHPPYMSTLRKIAGVDLYPAPKVFRSGIVHHMVIVKTVLQHMKEAAEALHGGIPFWKVLLNERYVQLTCFLPISVVYNMFTVICFQSALEMTCRAPREGICGGGSTLSEYELYFNYARVVFPQTVALRPLLWANGPMPGLMFWPAIDDKTHSDRHKGNWLGHRQNDGKFDAIIELLDASTFCYIVNMSIRSAMWFAPCYSPLPFLSAVFLFSSCRIR